MSPFRKELHGAISQLNLTLRAARFIIVPLFSQLAAFPFPTGPPLTTAPFAKARALFRAEISASSCVELHSPHTISPFWGSCTLVHTLVRPLGGLWQKSYSNSGGPLYFSSNLPYICIRQSASQVSRGSPLLLKVNKQGGSGDVIAHGLGGSGDVIAPSPEAPSADAMPAPPTRFCQTQGPSATSGSATTESGTRRSGRGWMWCAVGR